MGNYLAAIWRCRFFWLSLVKMDLRTRYRRSILGMGWSLLHPIAMTVIICLVFRKLLKQDIQDFAPYLLGGLACWNYILTSTSVGCQSLFQGESYIRQYPAPLAIYPLRTTLGATIHFLMALLVVFTLTSCIRLYYRNSPVATGHTVAAPLKLATYQPAEESEAEAATHSPAGVQAPPPRTAWHFLPLLTLLPTLCLLFVFCWSLAVLAGFSNVFFQDTQHLCEVGFQILFYMTPIMYPKSILENNGLSWLLYVNPIAPMLDLIRDPIVEARFPLWTTYATACGLVGLVAGAAILAMARLQRRVIFYM